MSRRSGGPSDDRLTDAIRELSGRLAWPDAARVSEAVARRIEAAEVGAPPPRLSLPSRRRTLAILIAAILAIAGVAAAAKLVIDLGAITITNGPGLPTSAPTGSFGRATFGAPIDLSQAAAIAGFEPRLPAGWTPPDLVWADRTAVSFDGHRTTMIVMAWRPRAGLPAIGGTRWGAVVMEFRGQADVATKTLLEGRAALSSASVNGHAAWVISGEHELELLTPTGVRRFTSRAVAVLWDQDGLALRLETGLGRESALAVAARIPPA